MNQKKQPVSDALNIEAVSGLPDNIKTGTYIFLCVNISFEFIKEIQVIYSLGELIGSFMLNKANPLKILAPNQPEYTDIVPMLYDLEFRTEDGTYRQNNLAAGSCNFINNPFEYRYAQFLSVDMMYKDDYTDRIQLSYYYNERGPDWEITGKAKQAVLTSEAKTCSIRYPVVDCKRAVVVYEGNIISKKGKISSIPKNTSNQCIIPVSTDVVWISIEVDSERVNWTKYKMVKVCLYPCDTNDKDTPCGILKFDAAAGSLYWGYLDNISNRQPYYWEASYYIEAFPDPITTGMKQEPFNNYVVLPAEPFNQ
ncbi:hypothetical protein LY28_00257 [Ruminiclostridium sufflavum DSM 19573]|uniref:Uncharacterized protein n=1 Tax=Ruminiclostridium sufflavum DSM 19573 TaxID=1121337 RepID=A0A318XS63_9FIRM|nr:hypothetical protein [Ruminiclostridium sufflavum]PYG90374.1 hypothetical protein LY28_00257 [Ruminiclostridium sufflavum DSM 19573]